jgi:hypothetical protein
MYKHVTFICYKGRLGVKVTARQERAQISEHGDVLAVRNVHRAEGRAARDECQQRRIRDLRGGER